MKKLFCILGLSGFIAGAATVISCSSSDGVGSSSSTLTSSYSGPGSKWDTEFEANGTCTLTKYSDHTSTSPSLVIGCSYVRTTQGFYIITVTSTYGTNAPSIGSTAWAVVVNGYAAFVKPLDSGNEQVIAMLEAGSCPTADFTANWVIVKKSGSANANNTGSDFFGSASYTHSSEQLNLPAKHALTAGFPTVAGDTPMNGSCSNGIMEVSSGNTALMYLNPSGAIVHTEIHSSTDQSFIFALLQKSIGAKSNLDGSYACMLFDENFSSGEKIHPVTCSLNNGNGSCNLVTNVSTGATGDGVTLNLSGTADATITGVITGTLTDAGSNSGNIACMADTNAGGSGRVMLTCSGQSPGDTTKMFNFICTN